MRFLRAAKSSVVLPQLLELSAVISSLSRFFAIGDVGCVVDVGNWDVAVTFEDTEELEATRTAEEEDVAEEEVAVDEFGK